jgi:4-diphosphocytidyl-2-C-methyl-D-erythritol kinase
VVKEMKPLENLFNYQALIRLQKNIPVGAGLGGGSSDCAAALKGLNEFWEIGLPDDKLIRIGAKLGSDVPFFIRGGAALARGRGEVLQFVDFKLPYTILIVNPGIHISTKEAYSKVKIKNRSKPTDLLTEWKNNVNNPKALREAIVNDFEDSVFSSYPELKKLKTKLYHRGAVFALLSGSGSSLFGLFKSVETASKAASNFPQYYTYICNVG